MADNSEAPIKAAAKMQRELLAAHDAKEEAKLASWSKAEHSEHHGDHHEDGGWHAAEHQAEHRVAEKAGFGLAEHVIDRAAETTAERLLERGAQTTGERLLERGAQTTSERLIERGAEAAGERLLERSAEAAGERIVEHAAEAIGERLVVRGVSGATKLGKGAVETRIAAVGNKTTHGTVHAGAHAAALARGSGGLMFNGLKALQVLVPILGTGMVAHMAHEDWHRVHKEWHHRGKRFSTLLFLIAALCDSFDTIVHLFVVTNLTLMHIDHHLLHTLESRSMYAAVAALLSMIVGELISGRASKSDKTKEE